MSCLDAAAPVVAVREPSVCMGELEDAPSRHSACTLPKYVLVHLLDLHLHAVSLLQMRYTHIPVPQDIWGLLRRILLSRL